MLYSSSEDDNIDSDVEISEVHAMDIAREADRKEDAHKGHSICNESDYQKCESVLEIANKH